MSVHTAIIALSASLSNAINVGSEVPSAVVVRTDTEGAALTFQGSYDGTNFFNIYEDDSGSAELAVAVTANTINLLPRDKFRGIPIIKIRTGTSSSPTAQSGAAATLTLLTS